MSAMAMLRQLPEVRRDLHRAGIVAELTDYPADRSLEVPAACNERG